MDKSANKDLFAEDMEDLQGLELAAFALQNLLTVTSAANPLPSAVVKAYDDCGSSTEHFQSEQLGTQFQLKYALAKASQHCLYGEFAKFCEQFLLTAPDMKPLVECLGREKVEAHAQAEVESRVLLSLKGISQWMSKP